jgi:hypothetical protein
VRATLSEQGYRHIKDVELDDGVWMAKAKDPSGQKVKVKLDPLDGHIVVLDKEAVEDHH